MIEKKISRFMGISMGITMSVLMSIVGSFLGSVFFSYILPKHILNQPIERPVISVVIGFILSLLVSLCITMVIALALGFIVPMKKINDAIERKVGKKGLVCHFFQSLASDCMYTIIISLTMAFVMGALFSVPQEKKGAQAAIDGMNAQIAGIESTLSDLQNKEGALSDDEMGQIAQLSGEKEGIKAAVEKKEAALAKITLVPVALKNFATSFPIEFIIALIIIMIVEPIYQKIAFKKYIPNYGKGVAGDENI